MTLDLSHLAKDVREQAFESSVVRVRRVQEARWITHERVQRVLDELQWRFDYPTCSRMPCLLLYGDSGMGKTTAIEKFMRLHPRATIIRLGLRNPRLSSSICPPPRRSDASSRGSSNPFTRPSPL